jgi:hypothetical protein
MNAAAILQIIAVAGPTIRAGIRTYQELRDAIARSAAEGQISIEQQNELMIEVERHREMAESGDYPPHWFAKDGPMETAVR